MSKFYADDIKLDFSDVLIVPHGLRSYEGGCEPSRVNSRKDVRVETLFSIDMGNAKRVIRGCPIIASNLSTVGTITMAKAMEQNNMFTSLHKFTPNVQLLEFFQTDESRKSLYTMGISKNDLKKFLDLYDMLPSDKKITKVMIEVANGYIESFYDFIKQFKAIFPTTIVFAGTVCTPEGVRILSHAGADVIRIGIGTGAVCTTRIKTGIGYPQLSALIECSEEARKQGKLILSDGGCQSAGDIVKAFCAGANFVMIGSLLAGTDECEHDKDDKGNLLYFGMSSHIAQQIHYNEQREYRGSEGRKVFIQPKGPVQPILDDIIGGIRSACTYLNAQQIDKLFERSKFIRVNHQYNAMLEN